MAKKISNFDVIIVGGGPGGLSSLLWCSELGLNAILLEKQTEFGGQLLLTYNAVRNHLGVEAASGRDLCGRFLDQIEKTNIGRHTSAEIVRADLAQKTVILADGVDNIGKAIILATGVKRRRLGVPGEDVFRDRGILESGERLKNEIEGKRIVIVGGGDAALENALTLSEKAERVFIVHRRDLFSARPEFVARVANNEKIRFLPETVVVAIVGDKAVNAVEVRDLKTGQVSTMPADAILIRVGVEPNTEIFRGQIDLDPQGYIRVNGSCETDVSGVFAVGDVAEPFAKTISGAVGMGATAAKSAFLIVHARSLP